MEVIDAADPAPLPADRRPARRLAHHPRKDRPPEGRARRRSPSSTVPSRPSGRWSRSGSTNCRRPIDRGNLWVDADPTRLEQIVVNLLNNAAKYTENGGDIRLTARREGGEIVITVKDNGVGIPPEKLPEMFELFAQGDRSLARSEGGLGIGLTIVKKLVEMHGGTHRGDERGARHRAASSPSGCPPATRPARRGPTLTRPPRERPRPAARILVVDDNVDTARGMAPAPEAPRPRRGDRPRRTRGPRGRRREYRPEFVLLDIGLPGMDGYEVAPRLRRRVVQETPSSSPSPATARTRIAAAQGGGLRPPPRQADRPRGPGHAPLECSVMIPLPLKWSGLCLYSPVVCLTTPSLFPTPWDP